MVANINICALRDISMVNGSMADDVTEEISTISVEITAGAYRELMQLFSAPSA